MHFPILSKHPLINNNLATLIIPNEPMLVYR